MRRLRTMLSLAAFAVAGCATVTVDGFRIDAGNYKAETARVLARAQFDFGCPGEKLQTKVLSVSTMVPDAVTEIGVSGCDHRGVYVWTRSGWVLDSVDAHLPPAPPPAAAAR